MDAPSSKFLFDSDEGRILCRELSQSRLRYDPHDYSIDVAVKILDGTDCLVRAACSSGKTGILALIIITMQELAKQKVSYPAAFHQSVENPAFIVICPTNALEVDLEEKLSKFNISAVAINSVRVQKVQDDITIDGTLWDMAKEATVVLISPEMLEGDKCRDLLDDPMFSQRIFLLTVDEVHLVSTWSKQFRKAYGRIGYVRNRLSSRTRLLLLTATLRSGKHFNTVMNSFSLVPGRFYDLHRSNLRPEIRVTTSTIHSSLKTSLCFPELLWIVGMSGISIIFTRDRSLTLRITLYLKNSCPAYASAIRKCDSSNDTDYEAETLEMLHGRDQYSIGLVLVSTTILTLGIDIRDVQRVVILDPLEFDEEIQQEGRVLREKTPGQIAEAYVYVSPRTLERAQEMVTDMAEGEGMSKQESEKDDKATLSLSMAQRLIASCHNVEQDRQYLNPVDIPCLCQSCALVPSTVLACICSGCKPGKNERDLVIWQRATSKELGASFVARAQQIFPQLHPTPLPKTDKPPQNITEKQMRTHMTKRLQDLRYSMFEEPDQKYSHHGLYTPDDFIPDAVIPIILDHFFALDSPVTLQRVTASFQLFPDWLDRIWRDIHDALPGLLQIHEAAHKDDLEKKKIASQKAKEKYLDKREEKVGIRRKLNTSDLGEDFTGHRWRYTNPNGSKTTFRLRLRPTELESQ